MIILPVVSVVEQGGSIQYDESIEPVVAVVYPTGHAVLTPPVQ